MSSSARSLWPREHGAYAQLGAPLATALGLCAPTPAAVLFAITACCAFLANEPLLVVLGHRGPRMRALDGRRAGLRLAVLSSVVALAGSGGLWLASRQAIEIAGVAAIFGAVMVALACRRAEHSLAGEIVAAIALPGAGAAVAVASGVAARFAVTVWAAWAIGYACSVLTIHVIIARHRRRPTAMDVAVAAALTTLTLAIAVCSAWVPVVLIAIPLCGVATGLAIHPPRATRLRAIGFALVGASVASGAIALVMA